MKFNTLTSSLVLSLLIAGSEVIAMEDNDENAWLKNSVSIMGQIKEANNNNNNAEVDALINQLTQSQAPTETLDISSLTKEEKESFSWFTNWFKATKSQTADEDFTKRQTHETSWSLWNLFTWKSSETTEVIIHSHANTTTTAEELIDVIEEVSSLKLTRTPAPTAYKVDADGKITITTDNNINASYQLTSSPLAVAENEIIKVPYNFTVQPGGRMALDLLNTAKNGWCGEELVLEEGTHEGTFVRRIPAGEAEATAVLRNYHLDQPGETTVTVNQFDILQAAPVSLTSTGNSAEYQPNTDGTLLVITDKNNHATYQAMSAPFSVKEGDTLKLHYNIDVLPGGRMSLGFLNTAQGGWYGEELVLEKGTHVGVFERTVPNGEITASVVLRNYHLEKPALTVFTVNELNLQK